MKVVFLIVVTLCVAVTSGLSKVVVRGAFTKCSKAVKAPPAAFEALLKTRKIPASQQEKCFMGCLYKEIGLTKNGVLNYEVAKGLVSLKYSDHPEQFKKAMSIMETCKTIKSSNDDCALGYKLRECFIVNSDEKFTPFLTETA